MKTEKFKPSQFVRDVFGHRGHKSKGWVKFIFEENDHPDCEPGCYLPKTVCDRCGTLFECNINGDAVFVKINGYWRATYLKDGNLNTKLYNEKPIHDATCDDLIVNSVMT